MRTSFVNVHLTKKTWRKLSSPRLARLWQARSLRANLNIMTHYRSAINSSQKLYLSFQWLFIVYLTAPRFPNRLCSGPHFGDTGSFGDVRDNITCFVPIQFIRQGPFEAFHANSTHTLHHVGLFHLINDPRIVSIFVKNHTPFPNHRVVVLRKQRRQTRADVISLSNGLRVWADTAVYVSPLSSVTKIVLRRFHQYEVVELVPASQSLKRGRDDWRLACGGTWVNLAIWPRI